MSDRILQRAKEINFQLMTSSPQKLKDYFLIQIVAPVGKNVLGINNKFYSVSNDGAETIVKLVDETIVITVSDNKVEIHKKYKDGSLILLIVDFVDDKGYVGDHLLTKEKLIATLESVFE